MRPRVDPAVLARALAKLARAGVTPPPPAVGVVVRQAVCENA